MVFAAGEARARVLELERDRHGQGSPHPRKPETLPANAHRTASPLPRFHQNATAPRRSSKKRSAQEADLI